MPGYSDILQVAFVGALVYLWISSTQEGELRGIKAIVRKLEVYADSIIFMILAKDTKGLGPKYNVDPDGLKDKNAPVKHVIFIRHGESDWNNIFNKGLNFGLVIRLFKGLFEESKMITGNGSLFLDSPLNEEGIEQALELRRFIESDKHPEADERLLELIKIIRGTSDTSSIVVSSTLRRAIATTTLGLWPRLQRRNEKIHIHSALQEISRNVDTRALSEARQLVDLPFSRIAKHCISENSNNSTFEPEKVYDLSENHGNKTRSFNGIKRLRAFGEWVFQREENTIIVGGHSLWFKHFFQTYLPFNCNHEAKTKKITNSGVVAFSMQRGVMEDGTAYYRIDPQSLKVVYGGFTSK